MSEDEIWREYEAATAEAYRILVAACAPYRAKAEREIAAIWERYKAQTDPLIARYRTATASQREKMHAKLTIIYRRKDIR
jgi:hypothetical protein